jgi:hypothetical protein
MRSAVLLSFVLASTCCLGKFLFNFYNGLRYFCQLAEPIENDGFINDIMGDLTV